MKKFLVILMVVAMASFLFVGCTTPPTPEPEPTPTPEPTVKTATPYITGASFSILATTTPSVRTSPTFTGVGAAGAIIKLYVDSVYAGVGTTGANGAFTAVGITGITLLEGTRKAYVTATVPGLAESDASTEYSFIYDVTAPTIASVVGDSSEEYITVTFSEAVTSASVAAATWRYATGTSAYPATVTLVPTTVTAPTSTTARLYAALTSGDALCAVRVMTTAVADVAGNLLVIPVYAYGSIVP